MIRVSEMIAKAGGVQKYDAAGLAARAEITDAVTLYCRAVDQRDWALMDLAFHPDATINFSIGEPLPYLEWVAFAKPIIDRMPMTFHQTGPSQIYLDKENAWADTYVTALHLVPTDAPADDFWNGQDQPYYGISNGRYLDHFVYREGRWKIVTRDVAVDTRFDVEIEKRFL